MAAGNAGGTAIVIKSNDSIAIFVAEMPREICEQCKEKWSTKIAKSFIVDDHRVDDVYDFYLCEKCEKKSDDRRQA